MLRCSHGINYEEGFLPRMALYYLWDLILQFTVLRFPLPQSGRLSMNLTWCLGEVGRRSSFSPKTPSFSPKSIAVFDKYLTPGDCQVLCCGSGMV